MNHTTIVTQWVTKRLKRDGMRHRSLPRTTDIIYSYGTHFPMARHIVIDGTPHVLLHPDYYSSTTSRHQSLVRGVCRRESIPCYAVRKNYWKSIEENPTQQELEIAKTSTAQDLEEARVEKIRSRYEASKSQRQWRIRNAKECLALLPLPQGILDSIFKYDTQVLGVHSWVSACSRIHELHKKLDTRQYNGVSWEACRRIVQFPGGFINHLVETAPECFTSHKNLGATIKFFIELQ